MPSKKTRPDWFENNVHIAVHKPRWDKAKAAAILAFPGEIARTSGNKAVLKQLIDAGLKALDGKSNIPLPLGGQVKIK